MNRFESNIEVINILKTMAYAHPKLRLHQLLLMMDVNHTNIGENDVPVIVDDFYTESNVVLERIKKALAKMTSNEEIELLCRNGFLKKPSNVTQTPDEVIHLNRGQSEEYKFQKGDRVCFHGVMGTVTSDPTPSGFEVTFDKKEAQKQMFYSDGKFCAWEDKLSLVLVSRPKKKVKRMVSRWALYDDRGFLGSYMSKDEAQSDTFYAIDNKPLYLVELKGEYETEED
jgi:hypothetical protein